MIDLNVPQAAQERGGHLRLVHDSSIDAQSAGPEIAQSSESAQMSSNDGASDISSTGSTVSSDQVAPTLVTPVVAAAKATDMPDVSTERLAKLEGSYDALKVVRPMTIAVCSVLLAALVFVLGAITFQIQSLSTKVDALPRQLSEEFRALRAEQSAQTSAIANAITASKQVVPQVLLLAPPPGTQSAPEAPRPTPSNRR